MTAGASTPLPPALAGERVAIDGGNAGALCGYATGAAAAAGAVPLLLVHSVNAAASAAEVRPLFEHALSTRRPALAIDLPGYGCSERSDREYTPRRMTDALHAAIAWLRARHGVAAVDVLGVSLGAEFVARAAAEAPATIRRVVLVSPTGFSGLTSRRGSPGSVVGKPWVGTLLRGPGHGPGRGSGWGGPLFRGLTRPAVIRYFLKRTWGSSNIDEALWRYDIATTRQPGAEHAPLAFLSARLFSADIVDVYERVAQPVWMSHGTRGDFTDYRGKTTVEGRANWTITVFPTGAMPYFEVPADFHARLDAFLDG